MEGNKDLASNFSDLIRKCADWQCQVASADMDTLPVVRKVAAPPLAVNKAMTSLWSW